MIYIYRSFTLTMAHLKNFFIIIIIIIQLLLLWFFIATFILIRDSHMILHQHYNFLFISLVRWIQLNSNIFKKKFILHSQRDERNITSILAKYCKKYISLPIEISKISKISKIEYTRKEKIIIFQGKKEQNRNKQIPLPDNFPRLPLCTFVVKYRNEKKLVEQRVTRTTTSIPTPRFFPLSSRTKFPDVCETQTEQRGGGLECRPPLFIKAQSGTHRGTEFQSDTGVPVARHSIVDRYICLSESCGRSITDRDILSR